VQRASVLAHLSVPGWEAAGRDDEGCIALVSSLGRGTGEVGQLGPEVPHEAPPRAHYFFNSNVRSIPEPAAINKDCNGLVRMAFSRVFSTACACWRPCR
jgi:hypothetical protein